MLIIPFSNPLGPHSGPAGDGVLYGSLPRMAPVTALSLDHLRTFARVFRGNADAGGALMWSDVTTAANNDASGDVSIFDATNPTADRLCVELSDGDEIEGLSLLVSTAAVLTGVPVADVFYRTASGWASAVAIVTPSMASTGLKRISFLKSQNPDVYLKASDVALIDHLTDPRNQPQMRALFVQFSGITAVTTVPLFTRVYKNIRHSAAHRGQNITSIVSQADNPDFSSRSTVLPVVQDLFLFGFDELVVRLFQGLYRHGSLTHQREWIYSNANGFAPLPAARISDPANQFRAALPTQQNVLTHNLTSTYAAGTWGNSGVGSTTMLQGDGYVEFKVGPSPSLAGFVGFSTSNPNNNYTSINWGCHVGHGGTAFVSAWVNGAQQGGTTWSIAAGDVLRIERADGVFTLSQNGTVRHTFAQQSTADVLIDTAFIFSAAIADLHLVRTELGYPVAVPITWGAATALTLAAGTDAKIASAATHQMTVAPPADWAKLSMTDDANVEHNRYWIGLRTTADMSSPAPPENFTLRAQPTKGAGAVGIPAPETATYTQVTVVARELALAASTLLLVNVTTGAVAMIDVPASTAISTATISMAVTRGDQLVLVQPMGHPSVNLGDGALYLS